MINDVVLKQPLYDMTLVSVCTKFKSLLPITSTVGISCLPKWRIERYLF